MPIFDLVAARRHHGRIGSLVRSTLVSAMLAMVAAAVCAWTAPVRAQEAAEAASGPPVDIAVFVSSRSDVCYDPGDVDAIKHIASDEVERINKAGGIRGRPIAVRFLDDERDAQQAVVNVRKAVENPQLLAMIGLSNSDRAKKVFEQEGEGIRKSGVPFLSAISVNSIFESSPNVYTMRPSQDADRIPVMTGFIREMGLSRAAYFGVEDQVFSATLGDGLKEAMAASGGLVADQRFKLADDKLDITQLSAAIQDLKVKQPDMLVMSVGGARAEDVIKALMAAEVTPPLLLTGRIDSLAADVIARYGNDIFSLVSDRLPDVDNDRLRRLIEKEPPDQWMFEGRKIKEAPGWAKGECEARPATALPDPLNSANLRAIGIGTQYADMIGLIAAAAKPADRDAKIEVLRKTVLSEIADGYAAGRGTFKGRFANWSFNPESRTATATPFVVVQPKGLGRTQLAPVQFVRLKSGKLRRVDTLYLDIDMLRAHRVEDSEKTFYAEFYMSMRDGPGAAIEKFEFTNAYLDPTTNGRQITVETLHGGGKSEAYPDEMKIYKVTGRFLFDPDLSGYPFDTQRFSIDIQPKHGDAPFIVQPPPASLRDKTMATDGWQPKVQYVGYDEDFVPVLDARSHEPSVVPFYKASFVWLMKRQTTDYILRAVVPLAFILIVAYLSIFIPSSHFEAIVTIQVTALLSAVALYLSIPQLGSETATQSDRIFVFDYMMVSIMIVISILRVNRHVTERPGLKRALGWAHVAGVPLVVLAMGLQLWRLAGAE